MSSSMLLLLGAGLLFLALALSLVAHRRRHQRAPRRRPLGRGHPGPRLRARRPQGGARAALRRAGPRPPGRPVRRRRSQDSCGPTRPRSSSTGSTSPATRRRGTSTASSVSRCWACRSSAPLGFLYLLGFGWPFYRVVLATWLLAALRLRAAQHPALQRRPEAREADAQRPAGRHRPADRLGRGRPRVRRGRRPGRAEHQGPAVPGVRPTAPGDADRRGPHRGHARHGRAHLPRRTSSPSAWPWCRPTASASRSAGCCGSRARRCGPSAASAPRRRPSRCRCGS